MSEVQNLLVLPCLRVQNANAISSQMTWGFPAMSAFIGLMHALERKLAASDISLLFDGVGVICHDFEAQATEGGFTRTFHLTRNPVDRSGGTAAIVEEGRVHLDITLVFAVRGDACGGNEAERGALAKEVDEIVAGMRIAGGSVIPALPGRTSRSRPALIPLEENGEERDEQFRRLKRRWLPGFTLVSRDDLLAQRFEEMHEASPVATLLDAWLDLSRLNHECYLKPVESDKGEIHEEVSWEIRRPPGWIVPIPIGYGALSEVFEPGTVANSRDAETPFRFVESLYSIGQWISPHRLQRPEELLWYVDNDLDAGLYRLNNDYHNRSTTA
ncbi:type I-F CRISPR-associated protein Csy2 [Halomonas sp. DQ26W]|uniref:type I-F CRISPR-associated protein Csy2 n=1 Tax=Halomonas sp. DQ26W TaxID=2282311 RepID=UPI000DF7287A|nr:type I-F CRISPR-associated protein Csy2 [Halomonas sp. DQ26W]RDB44354.1 type I-F CRISPR-associated protein Csy2 [Halomonas sp. DQ26W]